MEKRIELEKRGRNPAKITELILDNCKSTSIVGLSAEFENLEVLSLINVGLTSLKGFPALANLRKLELSDNRIQGGLSALTCLPKLAYLNLSGNRIKDIETLEPLKDLKSLVTLDLFSCEVSVLENYREKVFALIPSLVYLDGFDKEDNSEDEDGEEEEGVLEYDNEQDEDIGEEEEDIDDINEEEVEEEEEEDDDEEDVPLDALYKDYNPSGDDDYEAVEGEEEDDDIVEEEEEEEGANNRGQKRKLEDGED
ncbi:acidic leucine-rich nuclear phosphoprotein 32 family member B-like [Macrobrachium rosenbergii]|uniref:acidic leucine-rich nuclear phosphoprotein 32 family member B-like n=1 Tax=Macrobrachium rosenbergii TaxID=79674 RepID=UPI0030C86442